MTESAKKHAFRLILIALAFFLPGTRPLYAQFSGNIDLTFTASPEELTVGDPVTLTLEVTYPGNLELTIPPLPETWGDFEVRRQSEPETVLTGSGGKTTTQTIEAALFKPGTFQTPTWAVSLRDPNGQPLERAVPQVSLTVASVLAAGDTSLRDIKPQAEMPVPPLWPWVVGGALLAAVLFWAGRKLYRRLKARRGTPIQPVPLPVIDLRPPYQIAGEELARIEALDLPGQGRFKEYYTLTADCLRRYVDGMYRIPALDLTTAEMKRALKQAHVAPAHASRFIALFAAGDLVKFARLTPGLEEARQLIPQARAIIDLTKPAAEPTEEVAA